MTTVRELLDGKGRNVWSIAEDATVYEAVAMMAEKNVGALTVTSATSKLAGIISERDYTRKIILNSRASKETRVSEIMTPDVTFAIEDTPVEKCMTLMTQKRIRHLPIVEGNNPVGMITLGDIMKTVIREQSLTIEELESFMFEDQGGEG